jgi:cellulose synthase/poly-beta-1,6-N-acetylglucosamine synthase-like glycosyltransferase
MQAVIAALVYFAVISVTVPCVVLLLEVIASRLPARYTSTTQIDPVRPTIAVLVPAHNEELTIAGTVSAIRAQLAPTDRIIVIADNCTDATARLATTAGAEVVERCDPLRRGKAYAIRRGLEYVRLQRPDVLILIDADTRPQPNSIHALAVQAVRSNRPSQAIYVLEPPARLKNQDILSHFAMLLKNRIRPRGLARLRLPCHITGSGIALPCHLTDRLSTIKNHLVEDMQFGVALAIDGTPAQLCEAATITGELPDLHRAAFTQRRRWEHGHLATIIECAPRLVCHAILRRRLTLLALALDLSIPPLSLLCIAWLTVALGSCLAAIFLPSLMLAPFVITLAAGTSLFVAIILAWLFDGRRSVPLVALISVPFYVCWKVPLYLGFVFSRQQAWVRTARTHPLKSRFH